MVMVRGQYNQKLFHGQLDRYFEVGQNLIAPIYKQYFNLEGSDQAEEVQLGAVGIGLPQEKHETGAFAQSEFLNGIESRAIHLTYGLMLVFSKEFLADQKRGNFASKASQELGRNMVILQDILAADVLNGGFSGTWNPNVAVPLFSNAHVLADGSTWSNILATPRDMSIELVQDFGTLAKRTKNPRGFWTRYKLMKFKIAPEQEWKTREILESGERPDTADRATNVVKGYVSYFVDEYQTDTDATFAFADRHELQFFTRQAPDTQMEKVPLSKGAEAYLVDARFSTLVSDPRGLYATPGAG